VSGKKGLAASLIDVDGGGGGCGVLEMARPQELDF